MINRNAQAKGTIRLHKKNGKRFYSSRGQIFKTTKKEKEIINDGKIRNEISLLIIKYVFENKSLAELINILNSNKKYMTYRNYFETWIKDRIKKKQEIIELINNKIKCGMSKEEINEFFEHIKKYEGYKSYFEILISEAHGNNEKVH